MIKELQSIVLLHSYIIIAYETSLSTLALSHDISLNESPAVTLPHPRSAGAGTIREHHEADSGQHRLRRHRPHPLR